MERPSEVLRGKEMSEDYYDNYNDYMNNDEHNDDITCKYCGTECTHTPLYYICDNCYVAYFNNVQSEAMKTAVTEIGYAHTCLLYHLSKDEYVSRLQYDKEREKIKKGIYDLVVRRAGLSCNIRTKDVENRVIYYLARHELKTNAYFERREDIVGDYS